MAETEKPRAIELPWKLPHDEMTANLAIGGIRESLLLWLKSERGVHSETLLVAVGALAGFAAQRAAWARLARRDLPLPPSVMQAAAGTSDTALNLLSEELRTRGLFVTVATKSGETFYFGDLINGYLVPQATSSHPLWGFVAAAAVHAGIPIAQLPDTGDMFRHVSATVGGAEFGVPRVPAEHQPHWPARQLLETFWPSAQNLLTRTDGPGDAAGHSVAPEHWPVVLAIVAQQLVVLAKDTLDPKMGLSLVMESAIAMSKVDPKTVPTTMSENK